MKALIDEAAARATKTKIQPFGIKLFDMPESMERFQAQSLGSYLVPGTPSLTFRLRLGSGPNDGLDGAFSESEAQSATKHYSQIAVQYRTQYRVIGTVWLDRPTTSPVPLGF